MSIRLTDRAVLRPLELPARVDAGATVKTAGLLPINEHIGFAPIDHEGARRKDLT